MKERIWRGWDGWRDGWNERNVRRFWRGWDSVVQEGLRYPYPQFHYHKYNQKQPPKNQIIILNRIAKCWEKSTSREKRGDYILIQLLRSLPINEPTQPLNKNLLPILPPSPNKESPLLQRFLRKPFSDFCLQLPFHRFIFHDTPFSV